MNAKHTPGPWVVDYGYTAGHIKSVPEDVRPGVTSTPTICQYGHSCRAYSISDEEAAANARLIAAAPDLLEALQELLKTLEPEIPGSPGSSLEKARAAIANATDNS